MKTNFLVIVSRPIKDCKENTKQYLSFKSKLAALFIPTSLSKCLDVIECRRELSKTMGQRVIFTTFFVCFFENNLQF